MIRLKHISLNKMIGNPNIDEARRFPGRHSDRPKLQSIFPSQPIHKQGKRSVPPGESAFPAL
jgi:hypothetical protein